MPIRMTEDQAMRFNFGKAPKAPGNGGKAPRKAKAQKPADQLPENQVEAQVIGWLQMRGWMAKRNHVGLFCPFSSAKAGRIYPVRIGETGESDWFMYRPAPGGRPGLMQAFWLEAKAPGKTAEPDQVVWLQKRRALGFVGVVIDSLHTLECWYKAQGWDAEGGR